MMSYEIKRNSYGSALLRKLRMEQTEFEKRVTEGSAKDVYEKAFEISVKNDVVCAIGNELFNNECAFSEATLIRLINTGNLLDKIYRYILDYYDFSHFNDYIIQGLLEDAVT